MDAARSAERVANRVARAVDAVDDAVGRARGCGPADAALRRGPRLGQRMLERRRDLLGKLTAAVDEVGEVYAKLLELSTTAQLWSASTPTASSEAAQVNDSLDAIRGVFDELEADASSTRALL